MKPFKTTTVEHALKILIARMWKKKFILHYLNGYSTRPLKWAYVRPLQILHGGQLEIVWNKRIAEKAALAAIEIGEREWKGVGDAEKKV